MEVTIKLTLPEHRAEFEKKVFTTRDLFPSGEEFNKIPIDRQKIFIKLLLTTSDQAEDILKLAAHMEGGIYQRTNKKL